VFVPFQLNAKYVRSLVTMLALIVVWFTVIVDSFAGVGSMKSSSDT
jgi:hypothetical protein